MRRILTWVGLVAFAVALTAAAAPYRGFAQPAQAPTDTPPKFEPGRLGMETMALSAQSIKALGLSQAHAHLVVFPFSGGPAEEAGVRTGDVITDVDGTGVDQDFDIKRFGVGRIITLGVLRENERVPVSVTLGRWADGQNAADPSDVQEQRIAAYRSILALLDPRNFAHDWAAVQSNLGLSYASRNLGDHADNLEKSIEAYEAALSVLTREALPREWATIQVVLGYAYVGRRRVDGADNLEKAIAAFDAALTVVTREALPSEWALTQNGLGVTYGRRNLGDRADNLEKAIAAYGSALTVLTREALPRDWALTQNNLGIVYRDRVRGDEADNVEKAIAAFEAALTVRTREELPSDWAATQNTLGTAYWHRIRGDRADNVEKAIAAYEAALTVATRDALPHDWAVTQNNLGNAYRNRIRGDRADNLEKAIAAYEAALTVATREALPPDWARTQDNLGNAYRNRIRGDRGDNLEKAIAAHEAALTIRKRETLPQEWALTQSELGDAYRSRIRGHRTRNLEKAIAAYEAAITVWTREALPRNHLGTSRALGAALMDARDWQKASSAYASAREAFLQLFGQGLNDAEARHLITEAGPLFAEAAFAAAERGNLEQALQLANEGRARQLRVALRRQAIDLPAEKRPRYDALVAEIRGWERLTETTKGSDAVAALEKVAALRQQLGGLMAPHLPAEAGLAREVIPKGGAIVAPIVTGLGGKLLIVTNGVRLAGSDTLAPTKGAGTEGQRKDAAVTVSNPEGLTSISAIDLPELTTNRLDRLMRGDGKTGGWLGAYKAQSDLPAWLGAIDKLGPDLWELFGGALDRGLRERGIKPGARVVILPTAALGLLPLGLAQDPTSRVRLAETWEIAEAPSFEALATAAAQAAEPVTPSLAAAINPTGDLPFTEIEGALVAARFAGRPQLKLDTSVATADLVVAALKGKSYWHFASHGAFDWNDARQSGLVMREGETLTVGRLIETQGSLGRPRLVVLSACETGLYDIARNPDEFVGLPATFMQAGAAGVLGSLWQVDDLATALLMAKFYDLHLGPPGGAPAGGLPPPTALRQAQAWLRDSTRAELLAYAKMAAAKAKIDPTRLAELNGALTRGQRSASSRFAGIWKSLAERAEPLPKTKRTAATKPPPFQHPYFWAGFVYTGL